MYIECLVAERLPTQSLLHVSAASEPSLRAMSTFTAGSLQAELSALGRAVQILLTYSSSSVPPIRGAQAGRRVASEKWLSGVSYINLSIGSDGKRPLLRQHIVHSHIGLHQTYVPHHLHQHNTWLGVETFVSMTWGWVACLLLVTRQWWNNGALGWGCARPGWSRKANVLNSYIREQSAADATQLVCLICSMYDQGGTWRAHSALCSLTDFLRHRVLITNGSTDGGFYLATRPVLLATYEQCLNSGPGCEWRQHRRTGIGCWDGPPIRWLWHGNARNTVQLSRNPGVLNVTSKPSGLKQGRLLKCNWHLPLFKLVRDACYWWLACFFNIIFLIHYFITQQRNGPHEAQYETLCCLYFKYWANFSLDFWLGVYIMSLYILCVQTLCVLL